jgi:ribosome-binding protein aMBF1 (putative translation factor)
VPGVFIHGVGQKHDADQSGNRAVLSFSTLLAKCETKLAIIAVGGKDKLMSRTTTTPLPAVSRVIAELGESIRLARKRRGLSAALVAERAGMSRPTLRAIERGDAGVTVGAVANVLHCLGLEKDLARVARDDELGHQLQDAALPSRIRQKAKRAV